MVIAPSQMVGYHKLNEILPSLLITCNNENVEQVKSWRLHGVEFDQNRTWNNFIISKLKHCYLILSCPRKCKRYTPYHIKKQRNHLSQVVLVVEISFFKTLPL